MKDKTEGKEKTKSTEWRDDLVYVVKHGEALYLPLSKKISDELGVTKGSRVLVRIKKYREAEYA